MPAIPIHGRMPCPALIRIGWGKDQGLLPADMTGGPHADR
jgi:hypothetical protein